MIMARPKTVRGIDYQKNKFMKLLADYYRKNSYDFRLVKREGDVAIYSQHEPETGNVVAYEVFIVRRHEGLTFGDRKTEAAEYGPSNEEWGSYGYTVWTMEAAALKVEKLKKKLEAQEVGKKLRSA